ncbi:MAG: hypothetical protein AB3N13_12850 [Arenibacterium sp.]
MAVTEAGRNFIETFIMKLPPAPAAAGVQEDKSLTDHTALVAIWREAKEQSDAGISALQTKLRGHGHPDLKNIADAGLSRVTQGNQVGLMRALMDYSASGAADRDKARDRLVRQIEEYRKFLSGSRVIQLLENNPYGVKVTVRSVMASALDRISRKILE